MSTTPEPEDRAAGGHRDQAPRYGQYAEGHRPDEPWGSQGSQGTPTDHGAAGAHQQSERSQGPGAYGPSGSSTHQGQPYPQSSYGQQDGYGQSGFGHQPGGYAQQDPYAQQGPYAQQNGSAVPGGNGSPYAAQGYQNYSTYPQGSVRPAGWGLGLAAMICGIASIVLFWSGLFILAGIAAVVLGILALRKGKGAARPSKGMPITGIITGAVGILLSLAMIALFVFAATAGRDAYNECGHLVDDQDAYQQCVEGTI